MLILNLAIAAVIDGLSNAQQDDDRIFKGDHIDNMLDIWSYYDPYGKGKILINDFRFFMCEVAPPFGNN